MPSGIQYGTYLAHRGQPRITPSAPNAGVTSSNLDGLPTSQRTAKPATDVVRAVKSSRVTGRFGFGATEGREGGR